jgi:hypothetical protein
MIRRTPLKHSTKPLKRTPLKRRPIRPKIGACVRVKGFRQHTVIDRIYTDIPGGVYLHDAIGGYHSWSVTDLVRVKHRKPLKRSPLKRKPAKRRPEDVNKEYLAWLRTWPCFICFRQVCRAWNFDAMPLVGSRPFHAAGSRLRCGTTQTHHIHLSPGEPPIDRNAIPLGEKHHLHATAGGGPESVHTLGTKFWGFHGIDRQETLELLRRLYREETGKEV